MSADGKAPLRSHSPRQVESNHKIHQPAVHQEAFDGRTSRTEKDQQTTIRGSPRYRGRAEHQGTDPTIANNHLSHPESETTFPPRTSSRARSSAPGEPTELSPPPSLPQQSLYTAPNTRSPSLVTVAPSDLDNDIYSVEALDREQSQRRIGALQQQLRDVSRFNTRNVDSWKAYYEEELKKQADFHQRELQRLAISHEKDVESWKAYYKEELKKRADSHHRELQTRAGSHDRGLQEALYESEQLQAAKDDAKEQLQFVRQELKNEVGHMRERILELEGRAQQDKERHASELQNSIAIMDEAMKIVNQLEGRLGLAEEEVNQQRQKLLLHRDLELMLEEAKSQLLFQSDACNHLEAELRGYKAQMKRYHNLWQNARYQLRGEKLVLLHQITLRDRYISIFDQYQRIYNKNVKQRFIQNDKEMIQLKTVLVDLKVEKLQKVRTELEATEVHYGNLRNSIKATRSSRNALQGQRVDPNEDYETVDSRSSIKKAKLKEFHAELDRLYSKEKHVYATTNELQDQDQAISAEVLQLQEDIRKPTNQIQKPGGPVTTELKCVKRKLHRLHAEFIGIQRESNASLPDLVQDDNAEDDDVDDSSDDWHSRCHTPDRLTQVYAIHDDHGRSSIASQLLRKQKRASSYLPPSPWI
ncbi:hypothetical protein BKA65DRAFT_291805 [Rhexocercosporidium sp. MPI-PUGE-AT-0058]|nr:hypothetical protein BKA65DRAFT_291805 [Rhexocercosporidium sp. MPI-PUGE-AT-0058]